MARRCRAAAALGAALLLLATPAPGQEASFEYRVKAAYLFNFTKFVEWPGEALPPGAPITICVTGSNPFGAALEETIRGESVNGHPLETRAAPPADGCHVVFVPRGANAAALLRPFQRHAALTVGESDTFLHDGGMVNLVLDAGRVRFEINPEPAERAGIRISSRLLRLARPIDTQARR